MDTPIERRLTRLRAAGLLVGMITALLVVVSATAALAHARLISSDPADGATVNSPPSRLEMTFSEPLEAGFAQVQVFAPDESRVDAGAPTVDGDHVTQSLRPLRASGRYTVAYRVLSSDGHPINESYTFTYEGERQVEGGRDSQARQETARRRRRPVRNLMPLRLPNTSHTPPRTTHRPRRDSRQQRHLLQPSPRRAVQQRRWHRAVPHPRRAVSTWPPY